MPKYCFLSVPSWRASIILHHPILPQRLELIDGGIDQGGAVVGDVEVGVTRGFADDDEVVAFGVKFISAPLVPVGGAALLVTNDEHFHTFRFGAIQQLVGETGELGHATAFVGRGPVTRIALDGGHDGEELVEEAVAQAFRCVFVVAPGVVEILLDQLVIHHLHRRRL